MNIDSTKKRRPLGHLLVSLAGWKRLKIKSRLTELGISQGQWQGMLTYAEAHKLPTFVRDIIVEELPEAKDLFQHPKKPAVL
ncbi:hypothetical protein CLV98_12032 [Dyadobacter jejuensis]|uniref:Uncharacterized protein n=1 Tax=Dyadobacter jejuensis TaxID=1082580 RepID=A0A316A7K2_9BACT|nr:hypothetical protein [Dyadobacter jejuensis]PWJ53916.1 hypothetical protein CLV98_12032 [Dyadobacter jejuensis]